MPGQRGGAGIFWTQVGQVAGDGRGGVGLARPGAHDLGNPGSQAGQPVPARPCVTPGEAPCVTLHLLRVHVVVMAPLQAWKTRFREIRCLPRVTYLKSAEPGASAEGSKNYSPVSDSTSESRKLLEARLPSPHTDGGLGIGVTKLSGTRSEPGCPRGWDNGAHTCLLPGSLHPHASQGALLSGHINARTGAGPLCLRGDRHLSKETAEGRGVPPRGSWCGRRSMRGGQCGREVGCCRKEQLRGVMLWQSSTCLP